MLRIDEEYYITADDKQFVLMRRYKPTKEVKNKKSDKEYTECVIGYCSSIITALNKYRKEQMLKWTAHEQMSADVLIAKIRQMDKELLEKLSLFDDMKEAT